MPVAYEIDSESKIVVLTCGNVSFECWRRTMREVFADPRYAPGFELLIDCRTATLAPSATQVRYIVEFLSTNRAALGDAHIAVVTSDPAGYGMARMASLLAESAGIGLAAFKHPDEATAWFAGTSAAQLQSTGPMR
jgi:hypothetical protein